MYFLIVFCFCLYCLNFPLVILKGNSLKTLNYFIFGQIVFYGLMFNGLAIADEIINLIFLLFNIYRLVINKFDESNLNKIEFNSYSFNKRYATYLIFCIYMVFSSLRGILVSNDISIFRYVFIFSSLGILLIGFKSVYTSKDQLILIGKNIVSASLIYSLLYFSHGISLNLVGFDQFEKQGIEWVGSTSAIIPSALGLIIQSNFLKLKIGNYVLRYLSMAIVFAVISQYYDSRLGLIIIALNIIFNFYFRLNIFGKELFPILLMSLLIIVGFLSFSNIGSSIGNAQLSSLYVSPENIFNVFQVLGSTLSLDETYGDLDRIFFPLAALKMISSDILRFFFGVGLYAERVLLIPFVPTMQEMEYVPSLIRPPTFTTIIGGTGFLGVFLLITIYLSNLKYYLKISRKTLINTFCLLSLVLLSFNLSQNLDAFLCWIILAPWSINIIEQNA